MFGKKQKNIAAKLCFLVFAMKMLISATPMFVDTLDSHTILQVVLQLEIENTANNNNANNEDLHEHGVKVFKADSIDLFTFGHLYNQKTRQRAYLTDEKQRCFFDAAVPTPPPNC